ncbi:hypothetical protein SDC9_212405 [bioreactor metagenome]|uniref:Uncharacterized protein n=1 Tax=bioreactor metagenome TaxID=1076179 RepID=A0A645JPE9_9ZZZZ
MKYNTVWLEIEIIRSHQIAGRSISDIFQFLASSHFIIGHQLIPQQIGEQLLIFANKYIVQLNRSKGSQVDVQVSGCVHAVSTTRIFVVVNPVGKQIAFVVLHVSFNALIIRIPRSNLIIVLLLVFQIHGFQIFAVIGHIVFAELLDNLRCG